MRARDRTRPYHQPSQSDHTDDLQRWEYLSPGANSSNGGTSPRIRGAGKVKREGS